MKVLFIGTGNAFASGGRDPMAILLEDEGYGLLLDCGPSTLPALKRLGRAPSAIDAVLVSHLHGDHFAGAPFLVLHEIYERPRKKPLRFLGPEGTAETLTAVTRLLYPGLPDPDFELELRDVQPGRAESLGPFRFEPFEVDHFSSGTALGYRVQRGERSLVYSGDTAWTPELQRQAVGADLLVCECSSYETSLPRHMSHRDLVDHQDRLDAGRILLVHPGEDVLAHADALAFELARDGMEVLL